MDILSRNEDTGKQQPGEEQDETVQAIMDSGNRHYNEALALAHAGRSDEALAQIQAAISVVGNQPAYHNLLGTLYAQKGLYSEAIAAWQQCLSLDPEMEKASRSIERAHLMEEEGIEETRRRPYILWAVAGVLAAIVFFAGDTILAWKAFRQGQSIASLEQQRDTLRNDNLALQGRLSVYDKLPPDQWFAIQKQKDEAETKVRQLEEQIARLDQQHKDALAALEQQIGGFKAELDAKTREYQKLSQNYDEALQLKGDVAGLTSTLEVANGKVTNLQTSLDELREERNKIQEQLNQAQESTAKTYQEGQNAVVEERNRNGQIIEGLQQKIAQKEDEILALRRTHDNLRSANSMVIVALQALEENQFETAGEKLNQALVYAPNDPLAQALSNKVAEIIKDPVEQARLREEATRREQTRKEQVQRYVVQYRTDGETQIAKGRFEEAEVALRHALDLASDDASKKSIQALVDRAVEGKTRLALLLDDAHKAMEQGDLATAQQTLKEVLKTQPDHPQAKKLLEEMAL
ncbi:MAG TPA: tetratricopeptide repeat protein [bacterium]|nr:tetratricopeptide repeat protein [bacterium]